MKKLTYAVQNNIVLTDKDIQLLTLLSQCGVMKPEQSKICYGATSAYHLKRIQKLAAAGLLVHEYRYLRPTQTGLDMAGIDDKPLRLARYRYEEHALAVELASQLPDWEPIYSRKLKRASVLMNQSRCCVSIARKSIIYAVYIINEIPRAVNMSHLLTEFDDLPNAETREMPSIDRVLIFCTSDAVMQAMDKALDSRLPQRLRQCCLLPYPQGVEWFKRMWSPEILKFMAARFPGYYPSNRGMFHFEYKDKHIAIMLLNDLSKRNLLRSYAKNVQKTEHRSCIVVCAPGQELDIPGVEIVFIPENLERTLPDVK